VSRHGFSAPPGRNCRLFERFVSVSIGPVAQGIPCWAAWSVSSSQTVGAVDEFWFGKTEPTPMRSGSEFKTHLRVILELLLHPCVQKAWRFRPADLADEMGPAIPCPATRPARTPKGLTRQAPRRGRHFGVRTSSGIFEVTRRTMISVAVGAA